MKKSKLSFILLFIGGLLLVTGSGRFIHVLAQVEELAWGTPANLSQSGSATEPSLFTDAEGTYHVVWQDEFAGFIYTTGDGTTWSAPVSFRPPFTEPPFSVPTADDFDEFYKPRFVTDDSGRVHAFWVNTDGLLIYRRAVIANMTAADAWTAELRLSGSALVVAANADDNGRLHLAYIRPQPADTVPAGIYYRQSDDGGDSWSEPVLLYASEYFRSTSANDANLQLQIDNNGRIHIAWDNRALETVYRLHSADSGQTWGDPILIDSRQAEDDPDAAGPAKVRLSAIGDRLHLTWQASHAGENCTQYYQWSDDGGSSWSDLDVAYADSRGCPQDGRFFSSRNGLLIMMITYEDVIFMQAWDGEQWSETAAQDPMLSFVDPVTFRTVSLSCRTSTVLPDNTLLVIGCGTSNDTDIWTISRPLGELADWSSRFAQPSAWDAPIPVAESDVVLGQLAVVAAADGRLHALWNNTRDSVVAGSISDAGNRDIVRIFYSRFDGSSWSSPRPVLSPADGAYQPVAVTGPDGSLHVAWSGYDAGGVYYSRALADQAASVTEWISPIVLPGSEGIGAAPDILRDRAGQLFVAYSVPVNDQRGIYITRSENNGETWRDAVEVFSGVDADWQVVGAPRLTSSGANTLHLLWTRETVGTGTVAMVYSRSEDGGETWSAHQRVVQEDVVWYDIVGLGDRSLHRFWQTSSDNQLVLWYEFSLDDGVSWSTPSRIADPSTLGGPVTILVDPARQPHIFQLAGMTEGGLLLQAWSWNGVRWELDDGLDLGEELQGADLVTGAMTANGRFGVIFGAFITNPETGVLQDTLQYTSRIWNAPDVAPTPLPTLTPTPPAPPTATPAPLPSPTPTITFAEPNPNQDGGFSVGPLSTSDPVGSVVLSIIPAVLLLGIIFVIGLRFLRQK